MSHEHRDLHAKSDMPTPEQVGRQKRLLVFGLVGMVIVALVLLVASVAGLFAAGTKNLPPTASEKPTASASASAVATPTSAPSATAEPSASEGTAILPTGPGELLFNFTFACHISPLVSVPATTVLEDGRVIWADERNLYRVRQLSTTGLEQLRSEIETTGLFENSADYVLERREDAPEPPGHGLCIWSFVWSNGEAPSVEVNSVGWLGDEEEETYYEPAPERKQLDAIAMQLRDPEAWFADESDWLQPTSELFSPEQYLVLAAVYPPEVGTEGAPDFDSVTWPFEATPDAFGEPVSEQSLHRCAVAEAADVEQLSAELAAAGLEQFIDPLSGAMVTLPWATREAAVEVTIWHVMPDGTPTCDSVN